MGETVGGTLGWQKHVQVERDGHAMLVSYVP